MFEEIYLKDVKDDKGRLILSHNYLGKEEEDFRLFYFIKDSDEKKQGFYFYCVMYVASDGNKEKWSPETFVKPSYNGIAYFDGIRHLYFGDEKDQDYGYENYPNIDDHIKIFQYLNVLIERYCR